ncbi:MAG TPA: hypothetical protein VII94_01435 [Candidatus Saccharimonadales bacterium]
MSKFRKQLFKKLIKEADMEKNQEQPTTELPKDTDYGKQVADNILNKILDNIFNDIGSIN